MAAEVDYERREKAGCKEEASFEVRFDAKGAARARKTTKTAPQGVYCVFVWSNQPMYITALLRQSYLRPKQPNCACLQSESAASRRRGRPSHSSLCAAYSALLPVQAAPRRVPYHPQIFSVAPWSLLLRPAIYLVCVQLSLSSAAAPCIAATFHTTRIFVRQKQGDNT